MVTEVNLVKLDFRWEVDPDDNRLHRFTNGDMTLAWARHGFDVDKGQYSYRVGETYTHAMGECFILTLAEAKALAEPKVKAYINQKQLQLTKAYSFLKRVNMEPDLHMLATLY